MPRLSQVARLWTGGLVVLLLALVAFAGQAQAADGGERFAAIVVDAQTGETLYARHAEARRYPASLTKVMTLFLAFEAIESGKLKPTDRVTISPRAAARPPSRLGLPVGDHLTVRQAMDVMVVKSANDLATALAETVSGTESRFAKAMTAKARALGMNGTRFANASGLPDPGHYSTARDLALLGRAFLRDHPDAYAIFDQESVVFRGRRIQGHNALLSRDGIDGFKTGFVNASGFNLMTSGLRDGHRVVAVVLGGRTARSRDAYMARLIRASFAALTIRDAGTQLAVSDLLEIEDAMWARPRQPVSRPLLAAASAADTARAQGDGGPTATTGQAGRTWWIQVGAFRSQASGQARLAAVSARHPRRFGRRQSDLVRLGDLFAARFSAASRVGAEAACKVLLAEGEACLALAEWAPAHQEGHAPLAAEIIAERQTNAKDLSELHRRAESL